MKPIKIISDSTSDLSKELIEKYDIAILPLQVNLGDESRFDGVDIQPDEIYAWADKNGKTPTTSAPAPDAVEQFLGQFTDEYDIIAFTISSEMSSNTSSSKSSENSLYSARVSVSKTLPSAMHFATICPEIL